MNPISAVIITLNEERNIGRCLESLKSVADDVVVVDSFSSDKTKEICLQKGARFFQRDFKGYIEQKNYANSLAKYDLILSIDADEALSEELKDSIRRVKENQVHDGYVMKRLTSYCGRFIRHGGWYPDKKLRLFDRKKGKWAGMYIHEYVEMVKGSSSGELKGDLLHFSYFSISDHVKQANHFSDITAREYFEKGVKAGYIKILFGPCIKFLRDYMFRSGFLDGYYGFVIARISAMATFWKYSKLRDLSRKKSSLIQ